MKKILILDFDGTVIDSNYKKELAIINYIKEQHDINIFKIIDPFKLRKLNRYEILSIASKNKVDNDEKILLDLLINKSVKCSKIDPDLHSLYKICRESKIKIYLVTNTPEESIKDIVCFLKIDHYFDFIIGKKTNIRKSHIFKQIIETENVSPSEILSVGDNIDDYFASKENMIPFHGIQDSSLISLIRSIPISKSLRGVINSIKYNKTIEI